ncbi:MAG: SIR2 family protein [Clostridia bacterium]|jgi:hypothetical protein
MKCECAICKDNKPITIPEAILDAAKAEKLVLFCGAGISTENKNVLPLTFCESIQEDLGMENSDDSFCEIMQQFCDLPNGRRKLIKKIKTRFEYIHSFPEIEFWATRFHKELEELYFIKTIITTNWDTYFEDYSLAIPITIPEDFVLWDDKERCVLKIHGSINNLSTLIATKNDYEKCKENLEKGIIGASLRTIFATKTVVFFGFSFGDEDFNQILDYLNTEMRGLLPHIYIVTLDNQLSDKLKNSNYSCIITDGTYFLHQLKLILRKEGLIVNDQAKTWVDMMNDAVKIKHNEVSLLRCHDSPQVIYCLSYQDGILHAFSRFFQLYNKGDYNMPGYIESLVRGYNNKIKILKKKGNYWDVSYYEGYLNGLIYISSCSGELSIHIDFPQYYLPNAQKQMSSYEEFLSELKRVSKIKNKYQKYAESMTSEYSDSKCVIHHPPH